MQTFSCSILLWLASARTCYLHGVRAFASTSAYSVFASTTTIPRSTTIKREKTLKKKIKQKEASNNNSSSSSNSSNNIRTDPHLRPSGEYNIKERRKGSTGHRRCRARERFQNAETVAQVQFSGSPLTSEAFISEGPIIFI